ncbi:MAG: molybdopterin molybdotransferase MoeA [Acidobacteriota bacterium]|nr:molybdopterin molybdotransferase MoeA [Acidobacteriota bacterium]
MLTVKAAREMVLDHCRSIRPDRLATEVVPLPASQGRVLAEPVHLDTDQPPFDRSMRDGYAVKSRDLESLPARLRCVGEIKAGEVPTRVLKSGEAIQIMTGAPAPEGADAVVMVEHTECLPKDEVAVLRSVPSGANIAPRGSERRRGELLMPTSTRLGVLEVGGLAAVGKAQVQVFRRPEVGILATGDELVDVDQEPGPGQIRNSNAYSLSAQVVSHGGMPRVLATAGDTMEQLRRQIRLGLESDLLLVSGGVSAGKYDLVEEVFEEFGIQVLFEAVSMRPGKPTVFARREQQFVCGLPGNPVSTFVAFELFVAPVLQTLQGLPAGSLKVVRGRLHEKILEKSGRTALLPATVTLESGDIRIRPVSWKGSADIFSLADANGLVVVPLECSELAAGQEADALLFEPLTGLSGCEF